MIGIEHLPDAEKDKMLPVVLLAPWLNSIKFQNTFDRVEKSIGQRPIIVDVDRYYRSSSQLESRLYFNALVSGIDRDDLWIELIKQHENYIPCVQIFNRTLEQIRRQIDEFKTIGRSYALRFETNLTYDLHDIGKIVLENSEQDMLVIFDTGWQDFSDTQIRQVSNLIEWLTLINGHAKFVVSGSNFPNDFTDFENVGSISIGSRQLFDLLSKRFDNYQMYYGDWASTKPRIYDGGGSPPLPRIDFPTKDRWIISRSKQETWDFEAAAKRITRLPEWATRPSVWGTGLVERTAQGLPGGISTGPQAIAARVNIHLFMQNNFAVQNVSAISTDGQWVDPI